MLEVVKSVAFVLFSVMVALILQAHAEFDEMDSGDSVQSDKIVEQSSEQMSVQ